MCWRQIAGVTQEQYVDSFGNLCTRLVVPGGELQLHGSTLIEDSGKPDALGVGAVEHAVSDLPTETLQYLLASRYCEVDLLSPAAHDLFGGIEPGWPRVQAICGWVHWKVEFGYQYARPTKTALDVYTERAGRVPRLPASGHHLLPRAEYSGALRDRISGRYRHTIAAGADGFQRVVRGVSGRPLVDFRCAAQSTADWPRADGDGARRGGRCTDDVVRHCEPEEVLRSQRRGDEGRGDRA